MVIQGKLYVQMFLQLLSYIKLGLRILCVDDDLIKFSLKNKSWKKEYWFFLKISQKKYLLNEKYRVLSTLRSLYHHQETKNIVSVFHLVCTILVLANTEIRECGGTSLIKNWKSLSFYNSTCQCSFNIYYQSSYIHVYQGMTIPSYVTHSFPNRSNKTFS